MVPAHRILIVLPNWVGDVALATPAVRAIRRGHPHARVELLLRRYVHPVIAGTPWHDEALFWDEAGGSLGRLWRTARALRQRRYDLAVLLPNSFQSAAATWLGGARRRVGYARDGRTWLLTDPLPPKRPGDPTDAAARRGPDWPPPGPTVHRPRFAIRSVLDSYLDLARAAGGVTDGPDARQLELATAPDDEAACTAFLDRSGVGNQPYAVLNPGAAFGASKLWPAERFAELATRLRQRGLAVVVSFGPAERAIAQAIQAGCPEVVLLDDPARTIGTVKALVRRCAVMVTNDTGPRHFAIAFQRPVVAIFGPTHPAWTETGYASEVALQVPMACGPCQQKVCPLGTQECLTRLDVATVSAAVDRLLGQP